MGADGWITIYDLDKAYEIGLVIKECGHEKCENCVYDHPSDENYEECTECDYLEQSKICRYCIAVKDWEHTIERDYLIENDLYHIGNHVYTQEFLGHNIIHKYGSTEIYNDSRYKNDPEWLQNLLDRFMEKCYIDNWEVWT